MNRTVEIHIKELPEDAYLAPSEEIIYLVVQGSITVDVIQIGPT